MSSGLSQHVMGHTSLVDGCLAITGQSSLICPSCRCVLQGFAPKDVVAALLACDGDPNRAQFLALEQLALGGTAACKHGSDNDMLEKLDIWARQAEAQVALQRFTQSGTKCVLNMVPAQFQHGDMSQSGWNVVDIGERLSFWRRLLASQISISVVERHLWQQPIIMQLFEQLSEHVYMPPILILRFQTQWLRNWQRCKPDQHELLKASNS